MCICWVPTMGPILLWEPILLFISGLTVLLNHYSIWSNICTCVVHMPASSLFSPVRAKGNMKSLKQSLQPCFSSTNIACCSHHRSDLAMEVVTFWNVFSESQHQKGSNNNKKSTKSSEQVVSFQKSLHQGIHFLQCPRNQLFGVIGQVWVFSGKKKWGSLWRMWGWPCHYSFQLSNGSLPSFG